MGLNCLVLLSDISNHITWNLSLTVYATGQLAGNLYETRCRHDINRQYISTTVVSVGISCPKYSAHHIQFDTEHPPCQKPHTHPTYACSNCLSSHSLVKMVKSEHILTVDAGVTPVVELVTVQEETYFEYVHMYLVPFAHVCVCAYCIPYYLPAYVPVMAVLQPNVVFRHMTVNQLLPPCSLVVEFQLHGFNLPGSLE